MNALWDALEEISAVPARCGGGPTFYEGCRARVCGSHLIIYRTREGQVEISRILHGAMNPRDHVPRDFMGAG